MLVSFRFDRVCFDDVRTTCRFLDLGQYCVLCLSSSATVPLPMAIDIVLVGIVLVRLKIEVLGSDVPKMFSVGPSHSSTLRPEDIPSLDLTYQEQYQCTGTGPTPMLNCFRITWAIGVKTERTACSFLSIAGKTKSGSIPALANTPMGVSG